MRHFTIALASLGLLVLLTGCSDSHEKAAKDVLSCFDDINGILDKITDEASADAAIPKLQAVSTRIREIGDRVKKLPAATREQEDSIRKMLEERSRVQKDRFQANITRLSKANLGPKLFKVMDAATEGFRMRM